MRPTIVRTLVAGLAAGVTLFVGSFVGFVLVGSMLLSDPTVQSGKLLAVWNELEPLPLFTTAPHVVLAEYVLFGVAYAFLFRSVAPAWPASAWSRVWRLALVILIACAFFEVLAPFNLLGEPIPLVAVEMGLWAVAALPAAGALIAALGRSSVVAIEASRSVPLARERMGPSSAVVRDVGRDR